MKTTRQRILDLLESQRQATPAEIGRSLGLLPANVRHHLKILQDEGAVQVVGERRLPGRGRPQQLYASSRQALQNNYELLCSILLTHILQDLQEEQTPAFLQQLARDLLQVIPKGKNSPNRSAAGASDTSSSKALASRLVAAVQRLNTLHYEARWEAHTSAPRIIFAHCPYRQLVDGHPQLCQLDAAVLQSLLGRSVTQLEKLAQDQRGTVRCVFSLQVG